jgi:hypothetical protein
LTGTRSSADFPNLRAALISAERSLAAQIGSRSDGLELAQAERTARCRVVRVVLLQMITQADQPYAYAETRERRRRAEFPSIRARHCLTLGLGPPSPRPCLPLPTALLALDDHDDGRCDRADGADASKQKSSDTHVNSKA